ncbi:hypothetical protein BCR32DRAFT_246957 [Anaeromyces robustus]|uniref:Uncharacterized protein n=1 Tax=Anaeromyces robustus TaxID=1754192 RepID=A0A1Y1WYZ6_9FUNG|nr:hypothetical protein BCR32DRAFT_246957 [Anaeromyces robustus]|eukprot:ORX78723.1 hypothetical protein BCR32DRAFT_246957 [Anaeromyces robustus]
MYTIYFYLFNAKENNNISNMLKELNKINNENQQLKFETQIQDRKISNLENDLKQYKTENLNLKKELENKEKLCLTIIKEKKQKFENLEYLYSDSQFKLRNEQEENNNLKLYIKNLEKELEISKKWYKVL